jgi:hypothetical protein
VLKAARTNTIWHKNSLDSNSDHVPTVQINAAKCVEPVGVITNLITDQNTRSVRRAADAALSTLLTLRALELCGLH